MVHSSYWGVFAAMGHMLDKLEAPHDDVVEKMAPAPQAIPNSMMIEGSNNVQTAFCHYCLVPSLRPCHLPPPCRPPSRLFILHDEKTSVNNDMS